MDNVFNDNQTTMDIQKQIDYWTTGSDEDLAAAQDLLEKNHLRHTLFLAHLALEKMIKALVVRQTQDTPPKIHNLIRLAELAKISLDSDKEDLLRRFGLYQLEGRYPGVDPVPMDLRTAKDRMVSAKETLQWLKQQL